MIGKKYKIYRQTSTCTDFSKISERHIPNTIIIFTVRTLSNFVFAYGKPDSLNHILIKLNKNWKKSIDKKHITYLESPPLIRTFRKLSHLGGGKKFFARKGG